MKKFLFCVAIIPFASSTAFSQNNVCGVSINEIQIRPGSNNNNYTTISVQMSREWIELYNASCDSIDIAGWYIVTDIQNDLNNPILGYSEINSWSARFNNTMPYDQISGPLTTNSTFIPPKGFAVILTPSWNTLSASQYMVDIPNNTVILTPVNYDYWGSNGASGNTPPNGLLKNYNPGDFIKLYDGDPLNGATLMDSILWTDVNGLNASLQRDDDGVMRWHSSGTYANSGNYNRDTNNSILGRYTMGTENYSGQGAPCNYNTDFLIPDSICLGNTVNFNNLSTGGGSFYWDFDDGDTSTLFSPNHTYSNSGTYSVELIQLDQCFADTIIKTLTVLDSVNGNISNDTLICEGNAVTLTASGGNNYMWNNGSTTTSITVNPSVTSVYWVLISNGMCSDSLSVTVNVQAMPIIQISGAGVICRGDTVSLTANIGSVFLWNTGDTSQGIYVSPDIPTVYSVTVTEGVCTTMDSFQVDVDDIPQLSVSDDMEICFGQGVEISAQLSNASTFTWDNGSSDLTFTEYPSQSTNYTATASNWCGSVSEDVEVTVHPLPNVSAGEDASISRGESVQLHGSGGPSWNWSPDFDLDCPDCQHPNAKPEVTTTYTLTVVDDYGCRNSDDVTVFVSDFAHIFIPNAFTPNNDGFNDFFRAVGNEIEELSMLIYNRWGELIFQSDDLKAAWDGKVNGNPAPVGTYVYEIEYKTKGNSPSYRIGKVTLVK